MRFRDNFVHAVEKLRREISKYRRISPAFRIN